MNSRDIVEQLTTSTYLTKAEAKRAVDTVLTAISDAVARGEEVALNGFGKFKIRKSEAREGRNPRTGEPVAIKAAKRVSFKAAKALNDKVNG